VEVPPRGRRSRRGPRGGRDRRGRCGECLGSEVVVRVRVDSDNDERRPPQMNLTLMSAIRTLGACFA